MRMEIRYQVQGSVILEDKVLPKKIDRLTLVPFLHY